MKILYFLTGILFCLFSCKTQNYVSDNTNYSTPPEIGNVTVDLPRKSAYMSASDMGSITIDEPANTNLTSVKSDYTIETDIPISQKSKEIIHASPKENSVILENKSIVNTPTKVDPQATITTNPPLANIEANTISNKKEDKKSVKNSDIKIEKTVDEKTDSKEDDTSIKNLNVSDFSWEVGIKITQILDVRSLKEFKTGHIYDAINIDIDDPSFVNQIQSLDKTSPVAVYSQYGKRSSQAIKILKQYGFEILYNLDGGLNQWLKEKKEVFK